MFCKLSERGRLYVAHNSHAVRIEIFSAEHLCNRLAKPAVALVDVRVCAVHGQSVFKHFLMSAPFASSVFMLFIAEKKNG